MNSINHEMETNIITELEAIRQREGGRLKPASVVERAKDENSALHSHFEWDDSKAAHAHRLQQASNLIRRVKVVMGDREPKRVRLYVSLDSDRKSGGGYRDVQTVMDDETLYTEMLQIALGELNALWRKYEDLTELGPVFEEIAKATSVHVHGEGEED